MWLGLSKNVDRAAIESVLQEQLTPRDVGLFLEYPDGDWPDVTATLDTNQSEFPLVVNFHTLARENRAAQWLCFKMARTIAIHFGCRTICDGSGFGDEQPLGPLFWIPKAARTWPMTVTPDSLMARASLSESFEKST